MKDELHDIPIDPNKLPSETQELIKRGMKDPLIIDPGARKVFYGNMSAEISRPKKVKKRLWQFVIILVAAEIIILAACWFLIKQ